MTEKAAIKQLEFARILSDLPKEKEAIEMAIQALEEIEQYRAIGTVEEVKEIRNNSIDEFIDELLNWKPQDEEYRSLCNVCYEIAEQLKKEGE